MLMPIVWDQCFLLTILNPNRILPICHFLYLLIPTDFEELIGLYMHFVEAVFIPIFLIQEIEKRLSKYRCIPAKYMKGVCHFMIRGNLLHL